MWCVARRVCPLGFSPANCLPSLSSCNRCTRKEDCVVVAAGVASPESVSALLSVGVGCLNDCYNNGVCVNGTVCQCYTRSDIDPLNPFCAPLANGTTVPTTPISTKSSASSIVAAVSLIVVAMLALLF